jgi:hypothetical protein
MNRRETLLGLARIAGFHGDSKRFTRLVVESRIARRHLDDAWRAGVKQRDQGIPCNCPECKS